MLHICFACKQTNRKHVKQRCRDKVTRDILSACLKKTQEDKNEKELGLHWRWHDTCYMTPHVTVGAGLISSPWLLTVPFINGSLLWARSAYFRALHCVQISSSIRCYSRRHIQDKDMIHQMTLHCCSGTHHLFFKPTWQTTGKPRDGFIRAKRRCNRWWCVGHKIRTVTHTSMPSHTVWCNRPVIKTIKRPVIYTQYTLKNKCHLINSLEMSLQTVSAGYG